VTDDELLATALAAPDAGSVVLHLIADEATHVLDEVLAEPLDGGRYRVLRTPPLTIGIAAGDTIEVTDWSSGRFAVLDRGGNLGIQLFLGPAAAPGTGRAVDDDLTRGIEALGGRLDDRVDDRVVVYTIPVEAGFDAVQTVLNAFVSRHPGAEWIFSNVYDPEDGVTPLNWWTA
jgi:hypothetical protein